MKSAKKVLQNLKQKCLDKIEEFRYVPWMIKHEDIFGKPTEYLEKLSFYFPTHSRSKDLLPKIILCLIFLNNSVFFTMDAVDMFSDLAITNRTLFGSIYLLGWVFVGGKLVHYYYAKKEIEDMPNSLQEFYLKKFSDNAGKYFWHLKLLRIGIKFTMYACIFSVALTPVAVYFIYGNIITPLPIPSWIWVPPNLNYSYPLLYLWSLSILIQSIKIYFLFDMMTFTIFSAISLEWEILDENFRKCI